MLGGILDSFFAFEIIYSLYCEDKTRWLEMETGNNVHAGLEIK